EGTFRLYFEPVGIALAQIVNRIDDVGRLPRNDCAAENAGSAAASQMEVERSLHDVHNTVDDQTQHPLPVDENKDRMPALPVRRLSFQVDKRHQPSPILEHGA